MFQGSEAYCTPHPLRCCCPSDLICASLCIRVSLARLSLGLCLPSDGAASGFSFPPLSGTCMESGTCCYGPYCQLCKPEQHPTTSAFMPSTCAGASRRKRPVGTGEGATGKGSQVRGEGLVW